MQIMRQEEELAAVSAESQTLERLLSLLHAQAQCHSRGAVLHAAAAAITALCSCELGCVHLVQTTFRGKHVLTASSAMPEKLQVEQLLFWYLTLCL